ncbi:GNAT family N-acetyltransferase [Oceanococcus atlanticus]|uniref:GNAT family N-acetyltransferase n=1 Tax=Oceanococcus atlanticus TaxID=1317117 RepID=UPI0019824745|nr:GNAT family N-acetyltransferase [Oceanococcus atlanticus]
MQEIFPSSVPRSNKSLQVTFAPPRTFASAKARVAANGLGRRLMRAAESALEARGCPKLNIQVRSTNEAVLAFYNKLGYTVDPVVSLGKRLIQDTQQ